jgi:hypothetical protein
MARSLSDASGDEDGGGCGIHIGELALQASFSSGQLPDIASRELAPIVLLLSLYGDLLGGLTLAAGTDSQNVFSGVNKGISYNASLRPLLKRLAVLCDDFGVDVVCDWVPREANDFADRLSKARSLSEIPAIFRERHDAARAAGGARH